MMVSQPLRVLFIWHHHQPYYKTDGTFLMPWVRMHGIKDYWDMVRMLDDFPKIKQTFNFAPSLLEQILDYLNGAATDTAYLLSRKNPESFSEPDKLSALKTFFMANPERMIKRYTRYAELLAKRGVVKNETELYSVADRFSVQDFRDLQVWWNLSWVGEYSRFDPPFKFYLDKQRDFSEEEKLKLLSAQTEIISRIIPHHMEAVKRKQIEVSVSPFYHPILPLLCDSNIAADANPRTVLPNHRYEYSGDADGQIKSALDYGRSVFGQPPSGMWPSEGSVSNEVLRLMAKNRVNWVATDEAILRKTLTKSGKAVSEDFLERYFPYSFVSGRYPVKIFFRDHNLSDKIGFVYSNWSPDDAAHDFLTNLLRIRKSLVDNYGEKGLSAAVVPVILDGENAWEFYQSDGKDFLRTLYYLISNEPRIETVLPSDVTVNKDRSIKHIEPGSWINGNFDIWIGHEEDNKAWDLLHEARESFERISAKLPAKRRAQAFREITISEGSDWCWWYGDEHKSSQAAEFDELFRYHLKQVYSILRIDAPPQLDEPIKRRVEQLNYRQPARSISPKVGVERVAAGWKNAGFIGQEQLTGAMQKAGLQIKRVSFGNDRTSIYLMIETTEQRPTAKFVIEFLSPVGMTLEIGTSFTCRTDSLQDDLSLSVRYKAGTNLQLQISYGEIKSGEAAFSVSVYDQDTLIDSLPHQGLAKFRLF